MDFSKLFTIAEAKGCEAFQLYYAASDDFNVEVFKGDLDKYELSNSGSLAVKGLYNGKMGYSSTKNVDESQFEFLVDNVIASASVVESKDEQFIYEGDKEYKTLEGLYNESLNHVEKKDKMDLAFKLESLCKSKDSRVDMVEAFYSDGTTTVTMENSKGLKLSRKVNVAFLGAYVIAKEDGDSRTGFEFDRSNQFESFDLDKIATKAVEKAVSMLGASPCESGQYDVVLTPGASASLFSAFSGMFSAEAVQKKMSLLTDELGKQVFSSKITIIDDPFMKNSSKSSSFDSDGVATKYKEIVKDGVLQTFLHSLKTAKKAGVKSTGNASGVYNFYIEPGTASQDELITSTQKGILVRSFAGLHAGVNPITGDFSLQATGHLIENGKVTRPLALITIAGNYKTALNKEIVLASDLEFNMGYYGSPSIKIPELNVAGL
jgi:PmbA protein